MALLLRFIVMLIVAIIPFFRISKMITFLKNNVRNGGWLPSSYVSYYRYLDLCYQKVKEKVLASIDIKRNCVVIVDESTDRLQRPAVDIIISQALSQPKLIDIIQMEKVNFTTISRAITQALHNSKIPENNVAAFISDGASYMKKAWVQCLGGLFPDAVYIICFCHCLNLLIEDIMNHATTKMALDFMTNFR
jgi:hypothetical protein